jgi:hypothetical protein
MDRTDILELARRTASPAVSVFVPVEQPVTAHPEDALRLRALLAEAVKATATWWGAEAAERVGRHFEAAEPVLAPGEHAQGLAIFATPDDVEVLRLPFSVVEQVVADTTFATRQLFEGAARTIPYRVVVLDSLGGRLLEGAGDHLDEVARYGFPVRVERPVEQDTPHHDLPRHERAHDEDRRAVERAVADALAVAQAADARPYVIAGEHRRLAELQAVGLPDEHLAGVVTGDHTHDRPAEVAAVVRPVLDARLADERERARRRLRDALGEGRAVMTVPNVMAEATEGRGRELIVEEGLTMPRRWVDGLLPTDEPDPQITTEDVVDDLIEQVLLAGGDVTFVEQGSLDDCGQIGLLLRW